MKEASWANDSETKDSQARTTRRFGCLHLADILALLQQTSGVLNSSGEVAMKMLDDTEVQDEIRNLHITERRLSYRTAALLAELSGKR